MTARVGKTDRRALTATELEHLQAAADGETIPDTARRLWVSPQTVKFHRSHIFRKLDARNITHAVAIGIRRGIVE